MLEFANVLYFFFIGTMKVFHLRQASFICKFLFTSFIVFFSPVLCFFVFRTFWWFIGVWMIFNLNKLERFFKSIFFFTLIYSYNSFTNEACSFIFSIKNYIFSDPFPCLNSQILVMSCEIVLSVLNVLVVDSVKLWIVYFISINV